MPLLPPHPQNHTHCSKSQAVHSSRKHFPAVAKEGSGQHVQHVHSTLGLNEDSRKMTSLLGPCSSNDSPRTPALHSRWPPAALPRKPTGLSWPTHCQENFSQQWKMLALWALGHSCRGENEGSSFPALTMAGEGTPWCWLANKSPQREQETAAPYPTH